MRVLLNEKFNNKIIISIVVGVVSFILLMAFWNTEIFISDEEEIFVKGQQIANGQLLYKEIGSQHMPLMYYLSAVMSKMGITTVAGFRLGF